MRKPFEPLELLSILVMIINIIKTELPLSDKLTIRTGDLPMVSKEDMR